MVNGANQDIMKTTKLHAKQWQKQMHQQKDRKRGGGVFGWWPTATEPHADARTATSQMRRAIAAFEPQDGVGSSQRGETLN